jgi:hypothetical protein
MNIFVKVLKKHLKSFKFMLASVKKHWLIMKILFETTFRKLFPAFRCLFRNPHVILKIVPKVAFEINIQANLSFIK